ncbi:MAG: class I SAM-dependent methyltransferase, partial [Bacteroidota bacterium]
ITMSKRRGPFQNIEVNYIVGELDQLGNVHYDVVLAAFFLDVFTEENLAKVIRRLNHLLKPAGSLIVTDFVNTPKIWHKVLIGLMYIFFRLTTRLEGKRLLDFDFYLKGEGFVKDRCQSFFDGMIESAIYHKQSEMNYLPSGADL